MGGLARGEERPVPDTLRSLVKSMGWVEEIYEVLGIVGLCMAPARRDFWDATSPSLTLPLKKGEKMAAGCSRGLIPPKSDRFQGLEFGASHFFSGRCVQGTAPYGV